MSIKRKMALANPFDEDGFGSISWFELDGFKIEADHIEIRLRPSRLGIVNVYPSDAIGPVAGKGTIILTPTAFLKTSNFLQAMEDAVKANLDLP